MPDAGHEAGQEEAFRPNARRTATMGTYLDIYAATREARGGGTANETRAAARNLNVETGVAALVTSVLANLR